MRKFHILSWLAVLFASRDASGQSYADPAAALVLTPATFAILNPSIFGDNSTATVGGNYGHRPDARTYLFSGSLSRVRFQFGRTFWPGPAYGTKTLMTSFDYAHEFASRSIGPAIELVSGGQGSVGYGLINQGNGFAPEGLAAGILIASGAQFSGSGLRLTPYVSPAYYFARGSIAGIDNCGVNPCEGSGFRFSFGGGVRLDVLDRLSLEAGMRKTQAQRAITRRSFGVSYRLGNLDEHPLRDAGSFSIQWDNDLFARTSRLLDQDYTQGFHFTFNRKNGPRALTRALARIGGCEEHDGCANQASVLMGQEIYTPVYYPEVAPDDRPFGGWLYGGFRSSAVTDHDLTSLGVKLGVTGAASFAEQLQVTFHELFPSAIVPPGWDNQLQFEPGVIVTADKRSFSEIRSGSASLGLIKSGSASVGNILTDLEAGLTLRAGINDVHPWMLEQAHGVGLHASFGARGDFVLRNLFLDGNTFRSGPRVKRIPFVWQKSVGGGISFSSFSLDYQQTIRSKEFTTGRRYSSYGTISLTRRGQF